MSSTVNLDQLWRNMQAQACSCHDPLIQDVFATNIGDHHSFSSGLASLLGTKLADRSISATAITRLVTSILLEVPGIAESAAEDILAIHDRDPACPDLVTPFLFFKGWQALQVHRIAHHLWQKNRRHLAYHFQSRVNELFAIDIHPAARLGRRLSIDHGTGIVIGETCIIEDDVSLFQDVTLGGTGKLTGNRHPIVRRGAMIGSGAKVLGRLIIGENARIGAASVVLEDIPANATAVGNPARILEPSKVAAATDAKLPS
ncbi:serine O-acetyltransferase [Gluconobacter cerinus]|uniref:serine O-acetyltransferase n=1 Tax=Gluconobacter TaxID=441 RepID=UPI001B8AB5E0|nr:MULTISPECIES: serine O-acetyltransferase [Gluconobacter]MBS0993333.1 serine O-acetyltransferase [Gluconobacter cerinus]MBS1018521.1 serine O-acetyltransferase [Gluconobacter cerinus]MBS1021382.1 serine O-acetyltransferase [Gluconobacter cerinus]